MKQIVFSCLAACLLVTPLSAQTYLEWSERALQAIEKDSLEQAELCIRQALKLEPGNPHNAFLFSNLGTIQRRLQDTDRALDSYTMALNIAPRSVPVLLNRATLYLELGREASARADYSLVLDLQPDNLEALQMRAFISARQRDYKSARTDYVQLLKLDPQSYNGRLGLATLEQKEARYREAIELLNTMLIDRMDDTDSLTIFQRATIYVARAGVEWDMNHTDLALSDLEQAIQLSDSLPEAFLTRGQIWLAQGKKILARRDFERAHLLGVSLGELSGLLKQCR